MVPVEVAARGSIAKNIENDEVFEELEKKRAASGGGPGEEAGSGCLVTSPSGAVPGRPSRRRC